MNKKILYSLFAILYSLFFFFTFVSSAWAGCPWSCCSPDQCENHRSEYDYMCTPGEICCESCTPPGGGIYNPVIGIFGTQRGELTIAYLLATFLRLALVAAGILLLIYLTIGGIQWLTSGGDKTSVAAAREKITAAFIGLMLVVLVIVIINLVNIIFHLDILRPTLPTP